VDYRESFNKTTCKTINTMSINKSSRARGSNRGGCGGGYERTNPDFNSDRIRRLRAEYNQLEPQWRQIYLDGLSRFERGLVEDQTREIPE